MQGSVGLSRWRWPYVRRAAVVLRRRAPRRQCPRLTVRADQGTPVPRQDGTVTSGRDVFRFETFGNEGFWTDALRVPAGVTDARVTPLQALQLGLSMDIDAVDPSTQDTLTEQLRGDPSGRSSALLNDPKMTGRLIKANTVIGLAAKGEKVGVTCALCHTIART